MITATKIVLAHYKALYWKARVAQAEKHMRKSLETLATLGSGKYETEHGFFTVSENNTYPANVIRDALTPEERALCMESKWSNTRAKVLFPIAYENAKQRNGFKVSV
jgi:hypothetical protein